MIEVLKRPIESDYTSHVAYTRALEQYCDSLESQEPKCVVIIEVFGKDWRLEYMSLPVGKHKLYARQYLYTHPPQRKPLTDEWIQSRCNQSWVFETVKQWVREVEAAHGIKE